MNARRSDPVRFDTALERAVNFVRAHRSALGENTVIVRDLMGRIRLALGGNSSPPESLASDLHHLLGAFSPGVSQTILVHDELMAPSAVFNAGELQTIEPGVRLLERWVTGADWLRDHLPRTSKLAERVTFFGIKGGVGRSTALATSARHLAEQGKRVLVVDLDLESPGVTASDGSGKSASPRSGKSAAPRKERDG